MSVLFRLSGAARRDPEVEAWFSARTDMLRLIAREWFEAMRACGPDVRELMHDGCPVACVQDAAFGYVNTYKAHVTLGFYNGADLDDPADLLEGAGKRMRHVKVRPFHALDEAALNELVRASYAGVRAQLRSEAG